jgi:Carboxypeptidase regulatory-like domain
LTSFDSKFPQILYLLLVLLVLQSVIAQASDPIADRQAELARTTGTIAGKITDAKTGEALEHVSVSAQYLGDVTDASGAFEITDLDPGTVELTAWRRDLAESSQHVHVSAGQTVSVHVKMARAPTACCRLEGEWNITLILEQDRTNASAPAVKQLEGTVRFSPSIPDPLQERRRTRGDATVEEFGEYTIDLRPFFGDDIARSGITTVFPGREGADLLREADGYVYNGNQVEIYFIPRLSHGGISLNGQIDGDSIHGTWLKREYAPIFGGRFLMKRAQRPSTEGNQGGTEVDPRRR